MWFNFHTHSNYCDGKGTLNDYCDSAVKMDLISLGFSSHAPLPFDCKWCMPAPKLRKYTSEIDSFKRSNSSLQLYKSLEIDFIPGIVSTNDFRSQFDYTIGSVHFVDAFADGRHWEIDGPHQQFLEGLGQIFNDNMQHAVSRYYELTRQMISRATPTIVGHLDKIKIQNQQEKFFKESDSWYVDEINKTLDVIATTGVIVEVNTRGIYQNKSTTTYPSPWILELIHKKKIPMTISSDAHHPTDLINQFEQTATLLQRIGFKTISVLHDGKWKALAFDHNGVIVAE